MSKFPFSKFRCWKHKLGSMMKVVEDVSNEEQDEGELLYASVSLFATMPSVS